jgi:hypothetical protein
VSAVAAPDLTEFMALSKPRDQRRPCQVGRAAGQLTEPERAQLAAACATNTEAIATGAIQKWLAARGHQASLPAITSHRKGHCTCA